MPDSSNNFNYEYVPARWSLFFWNDSDSLPNVAVPASRDGNTLTQFTSDVGDVLSTAISPFNNVLGRKLTVLKDVHKIIGLQTPFFNVVYRRNLNKKITYYDEAEGTQFPDRKLIMFWYFPTTDKAFDFQYCVKLNYVDM